MLFENSPILSRASRSARIAGQFGSPPDEPDQKKRFLAVLSALDDAVGRVLKNVDNLGLRQQTIVLLFVSDNGAFMLPGRGREVQSNKPLRDGGVTTYEGGIRVTAIVRWPGRIKPGSVCREMLSSLDLLPLMLVAAGAKLPHDKRLDGRDPTRALALEAGSPHEALCWVWKEGTQNQWSAMREQQFKLVRPADAKAWELYDLHADIGEQNNLAAERPELVKKLATKFADWHEAAEKEGNAAIH